MTELVGELRLSEPSPARVVGNWEVDVRLARHPPATREERHSSFQLPANELMDAAKVAEGKSNSVLEFATGYGSQTTVEMLEVRKTLCKSQPVAFLLAPHTA